MFLEAAERRRLEDEDIRRWVRELKDVAYDADDIIVLCIVEGAAVSLADRPSSSKKITEEIYKDKLLIKLEESREPPKFQMITAVDTGQISPLEDGLGTEIEETTKEMKLIVAKKGKKCHIIHCLSIGSGFGGGTQTTIRTAFPNLQELHISDMELEEWSLNNEAEGFESGRGMTLMFFLI